MPGVVCCDVWRQLTQPDQIPHYLALIDHTNITVNITVVVVVAVALYSNCSVASITSGLDLISHKFSCQSCGMIHVLWLCYLFIVCITMHPYQLNLIKKTKNEFIQLYWFVSLQNQCMYRI